MDEITTALKNLKLRYVPRPSHPYQGKEKGDDKVDDVRDINGDTMIKLIDESFETYDKSGVRMRLPRRDSAVFESSVNRFVHTGKLRAVNPETKIIVLALLKIIRKMLVESSGLCSPRKFYYLLKNDASIEARDTLTSDQVNECLNDLCAWFKCSRSSLKLKYAPTNCVFGGCLQFEEIDIHGKTHVTDCSGMSRSYRLHLDSIHRLLTVESNPANFILVVEKLSVFESLMEENFCQKYPCVLVTGCGQPDVQCRTFVKMLHDSLQIPVCALVDFDAYGILIIKSYKVGSFKLAHESYRLTVPNLKFVGLSSKDLKELGIAKGKLTHMGEKELSLARSLKKEVWVEEGDNDIYDSLSGNIDGEKRAGIEILDMEKGFSFLANHYLPRKVKEILDK